MCSKGTYLPEEICQKFYPTNPPIPAIADPAINIGLLALDERMGLSVSRPENSTNTEIPMDTGTAGPDCDGTVDGMRLEFVGNRKVSKGRNWGDIMDDKNDETPLRHYLYYKPWWTFCDKSYFLMS